MSGYIGTQPVPQATQTRDSFTATSGQTSFATGGYTPNFLDVYLNGVKLASADYTASNGSDVVLASGAATGDILEVVAFTTFNSASSSIDDNGNATALTIDSSENVLVGKASADSNSVGIELHSNDIIKVTRSGGATGYFNRQTSDGNILELAKDGTTLGSIGVESNTHLVISTPSNGGSLIFEGNDTGGTDTRLAIENNTGGESFRPYNSYSDNKYNLGSGSRRFKDLYLSSGIYLGGAGSANHLEDYEVGTFTPVLEFGGGNTNITYSTRSGFYTKIGNVVYFYAECQLSSRGTSTGNLAIRDLPFSPQRTATSVSVLTGSLSSVNDIQIFLSTNGKINFENRNTGTQSSLTHNNVNSNSTFFVSGTYQTSG